MRKHNTLAERSVEWVGTNGRALAVRVALVESLTDHDGALPEMIRDRDGLNIAIDAVVDGEVRGLGTLTIYKAPRNGLAANVGEVIGLTAERLALVERARAELKAHPEWVAMEAAAAKARAEADEYRAARARVERAMAE